MFDIYDKLKGLPKEVILFYIHKLMLDGVVTFEDIAVQHSQYIEEVKKGVLIDYAELQGKIVSMWCGYKKDEHSNLREIMRYLKDKGRINITDENLNAR